MTGCPATPTFFFEAVTPREARLRNTALSFGVHHKASAQITWGLEYRHIATSYPIAGEQTDNHVNLAVTFAF